jgi:uncharacterized RDD family membrane protein YckC
MSEQPPTQQGYPPNYPPAQPPNQPAGYPPNPPAGYPPNYPPGYPPNYPPNQGQGYGGPGWQQPPELAGPAPGVRFSGHGARLGAYIVDSIILSILLSVLFFVVAIPLFGSTLSSIDWAGLQNRDYLTPDEAMTIMRPFFVLIPLGIGMGLLAMLYFVVGWARGGQTLGMKMAGIRVVRDRDGGRIGWGSAIVRLIGYWVSAAVFYLGFIWILIDSRRRGWHDLLAGTVVIADR